MLFRSSDVADGSSDPAAARWWSSDVANGSSDPAAARWWSASGRAGCSTGRSCRGWSRVRASSRRRSHELTTSCSPIDAVVRYQIIVKENPGRVESQSTGVSTAVSRSADEASDGHVRPSAWKRLDFTKITP